MPWLQAQSITLLASRIGLSGNVLRRKVDDMVRRTLMRLAAACDRRARAEAEIVERYVCHGWTDATERMIVDDIVKRGFE